MFVSLLEKVPTDSIHRNSIELNTGQAFWVSYSQKKTAAKNAGTLETDLPKLTPIREQAEKFLTNGQKVSYPTEYRSLQSQVSFGIGESLRRKERGQ